MEFACNCEQFYYGPTCDVYCNPLNQQFTCDSQGIRVWPRGMCYMYNDRACSMSIRNIVYVCVI